MSAQEQTVNLVRYSIADAEIAKLAEAYMPLAVADIEDRRGYELCKAARIDIREKRLDVEKTRVALKADALRWGRKVDTEAKRLAELLEPIETHLVEQERIYTVEQDRIKAAKAEEKKRKLQDRIDAMQSLGANTNIDALQEMSDVDFLLELQAARDTWTEAEAKRKADQEAADKLAAEQKALLDSLAAAKAEMEKIKAEAEAATAAAEKAKRDAEEASRVADARIKAEQDKADAVARARASEAERHRLEAEEKARREAEEAKVETERLEREKAMMPIREKIRAMAADVSDVLAKYGPDYPLGMMSDAARVVRDAVCRLRTLSNG